MRQNAFNNFRLIGGFNLTFHWIYIIFHLALIITSTVNVVITWTQVQHSASVLRAYIIFMTFTSAARIFKAIYNRRWPLTTITDFGTEVIRPINTFAGKAALFLHRNLDLMCIVASVMIMAMLDRYSAEDAEKHIPLLFWTTVTWALMYILYFVAPIFFILGLISCLPCIIIILQRFFNVSLINPNANDSRAAPATQEVLEKVWHVTYTTDESFKYVNPEKPEQTVSIEKEDTKCSICLGWYDDGDDLRILPCSHHFHQSCADEWFKITATCPLCVRPICPDSPPQPPGNNPDSNV